MKDNKVKVILCGNPNTGKTTLFNTIAKAQEKASNWHGVTVGVKEKVFSYKDQEFVLCDLPGIYSLEGISKEEEISRDYILNNKDNSIVVCVLDANNLKRNLLLALELKEICPHLIFAVNMANEIKCFNEQKLTECFNITTVGIDARKKKSVEKLKQQLLIKKENFKIEEKKDNVAGVIIDRLNNFEKVVSEQFNKIDQILKNSGYDKIGAYGQSKLDKIFLSKVWAPIVFVFVMGTVFFITFGFIGQTFAEFFQGIMQGCLTECANLIAKIISSQRILDFISEGIFKGVMNILGFLPQIILMSFCLNVLEDFGYLSRVAFMFDGLMKKVGLTGRSLFSLIMGFGCTTSAIITTRNLNGDKLRERTVLLLPFVSCSAKLPIYSVICSVFFSKYKALFVFLLYVFALFIMFIVSYIMKILTKRQEDAYYIMEMPKFRVPTLKKVFIDSVSVARSFVKKVGGSILIVSIIIYILYNRNFSFAIVENQNESIISVLSNKFAFLFKPLGFGVGGAVVAIATGLIAKEMVVSSLAIMNGCLVSELGLSLLNETSNICFTNISALSFLIFILLYSPCLSSLICMKKEIGKKNMIKSILLQTCIAYLISFIVHSFGRLINNGLWWLVILFLIFLAVAFMVVVKLIKKNVEKSNKEVVCLDCGVCNGNYCAQGK